VNGSDEKFYRARIVERQDLSEDLWIVRLDPGGEFHFQPGQYATLGKVTPEKHIERAYSIASAPFEPHLEFFLERVPQGALTPLLYKEQVGDTVTLRKVAKGRFTLDTASDRRNHLLICTVTGVAPFVSYVRAMHKDWAEGRSLGGNKLYLLEGASRSWEFGYRHELERYAAEVPWLKYVTTISRPWEDAGWKAELGRVDDLIRKYTDLWELTPETTSAYLCGHPSMIEHGKGILLRRGWQKIAMKEEIYFVPSKESLPAAD
jgi:ferredoxin--NADP+ reductase